MTARPRSAVAKRVAIAGRWAPRGTIASRSVASYSDRGCRAIAEHAFTDVAELLIDLEAAEAALAIAAELVAYAYDIQQLGEWAPYGPAAWLVWARDAQVWLTGRLPAASTYPSQLNYPADLMTWVPPSEDKP